MSEQDLELIASDASELDLPLNNDSQIERVAGDAETVDQARVCAGVASVACDSCAARDNCPILQMCRIVKEENRQPDPERQSYLDELLADNDDLVIAGYADATDNRQVTSNDAAVKVELMNITEPKVDTKSRQSLHRMEVIKNDTTQKQTANAKIDEIYESELNDNSILSAKIFDTPQEHKELNDTDRSKTKQTAVKPSSKRPALISDKSNSVAPIIENKSASTLAPLVEKIDNVTSTSDKTVFDDSHVSATIEATETNKIVRKHVTDVSEKLSTEKPGSQNKFHEQQKTVIATEEFLEKEGKKLNIPEPNKPDELDESSSIYQIPPEPETDITSDTIVDNYEVSTIEHSTKPDIPADSREKNVVSAETSDDKQDLSSCGNTVIDDNDFVVDEPVHEETIGWASDSRLFAAEREDVAENLAADADPDLSCDMTLPQEAINQSPNEVIDAQKEKVADAKMESELVVIDESSQVELIELDGSQEAAVHLAIVESKMQGATHDLYGSDNSVSLAMDEVDGKIDERPEDLQLSIVYPITMIDEAKANEVEDADTIQPMTDLCEEFVEALPEEEQHVYNYTKSETSTSGRGGGSVSWLVQLVGAVAVRVVRG